jgi:predicted small metal-binding protein
MATRDPARDTNQSRLIDSEEHMRAIECPCGHHLEGADDDELFRLAREHIISDHPDMQRTDEELRERIAADAYDVQPAAAP